MVGASESTVGESGVRDGVVSDPGARAGDVDPGTEEAVQKQRPKQSDLVIIIAMMLR